MADPSPPLTRGVLPDSARRPGVHVTRHTAADDVTDLVRHVWVPRWALPPGERVRQEILQYPGGNVAVLADEAAFYGVDAGLGTRELTGTGWAVGVLLRPAAAFLMLRRPLNEIADATITDLPGEFATLCARVRAHMSRPTPEETSAARHLQVWVRQVCGPVDDDGILANAIVDTVDPPHGPASGGRRDGVQTVRELADAVGISERHLQRICRTRIGLSPKWLLQRRRLQEAADRLSGGPAEHIELAALAVELGYGDQAHFTRDFTRVVGRPPGRFRADVADSDKT